MARIAYVRGAGPHRYDESTIGSAEDFLYIAQDIYPNEDITANWESISNCTVSNVVVNATLDINGITYRNVITARIGNFVGNLATTRLTVQGVSSSQPKVRELQIPIPY